MLNDWVKYYVQKGLGLGLGIRYQVLGIRYYVLGIRY